MHAHSCQRSYVRRRSTRAQSSVWHTHTCAALGTCMSHQRGCVCRRNTRTIASSVWHAHMCAALGMCTSRVRGPRRTHARACHARASTSVVRAVCHMCSVLARYAYARLYGIRMCDSRHLRCTRTRVSGSSATPHVLYACIVARGTTCTRTLERHALMSAVEQGEWYKPSETY